jgi:hypothetical protein
MVAHQTPGQHSPARFGAGFTQSFQEQSAISIFQGNRFTAVPAVYHVINRTRIFHSQLARHSTLLSKNSILYK